MAHQEGMGKQAQHIKILHIIFHQEGGFTMNMTGNPAEPVILSAVRTPSGRFQGSLSGMSATRLGAIVVKAAVERAGIQKPEEIDEVIMGNVVSAGLRIHQQAAIFSSVSVGAFTMVKYADPLRR
jgi:hypothetical protein